MNSFLNKFVLRKADYSMMNFAKGIMFGTIISAGIVWMYTEPQNKNKIIKKGKKMLKNMCI